jgi:SAM-dependent methyltransferase
MMTTRHGNSLAQGTPSVCTPSVLAVSWPDIENQVIGYFDGQVPVTDFWGVPIGKEHVAEYCSFHRTRFQYLTEVVRLLLPGGGRVLEVGAAYGVILLALKKIGYEVAAADMAEGINSYGIPLIRSGVSVLAWDIHKQTCPYSEGSFDVVIATEVLEHLQISLKTAVRRLLAPLSSHGWLVVTTPNLYTLSNLIALIKARNICETFPDEVALKDDVVVDGRCHPREPTMNERL